MDLKERIKQSMTEVICHLCTKEVPHKYQIQIEGTICISSDTEPPFAIQIAQLLSKADIDQSRPPGQCDREQFDHGDQGNSGSGDPGYQSKHRHHSSPADVPRYQGERGRHRKRTDSVREPGDRTALVPGLTEPLPTPLILPSPLPHIDTVINTNFPPTPSETTPTLSMEDPPSFTPNRLATPSDPGAPDGVDGRLSTEMPVVESVSPQGEVIQSTRRDSIERAPLPQKKRRRYSITMQETPQIITPDDNKVMDAVDSNVMSLPTKKRESARQLSVSEVDHGAGGDHIQAEVMDHTSGGDMTSGGSLTSPIEPENDGQFTVKDMVRNLIARDKGADSRVLYDLSKSLSAGQVKLVIPSASTSPPDTPLATPSGLDDHVFDLETPTTSQDARPGRQRSKTESDAKELTPLQPIFAYGDSLSPRIQSQTSPIGPIPVSHTDSTGLKRANRPNILSLPNRRRSTSAASYDPMNPSPSLIYPNNYHVMPIPDKPDEVKNEPKEPGYDTKSLLTSLGHMSKEAINGLIIVDQDTKTVSPQDYVYKDETTGETLIKACDYCGKHFKYLSKLMEHIRSHTKTKPYKCSICGRTYTYKGDLTVHIRQHSLAKPYACDCGRAFASKKYLSVHQSQARIKGRHAVSKDDRMGPMFECTQCGKRFKFFSSFDLHLQTHNTIGDKDRDRSADVYECQACDRSFRDHVMFVEHVLEHEHGNIHLGRVIQDTDLNRKKDEGPRESQERSRHLSLGVSTSPRDVERQRRHSEHIPPHKSPQHDVTGFFRPAAEVPTFIGPMSSSSGPLPSPIGQGNMVLSTLRWPSTSTSSVAMFPNVPLSQPRMLMPMMSPSGGAIVDTTKIFTDGHSSAGPFSPRILTPINSVPATGMIASHASEPLVIRVNDHFQALHQNKTPTTSSVTEPKLVAQPAVKL